ncbi:MAG: tetratricopeptide repeat protein, partial [Schlesneria sp.]
MPRLFLLSLVVICASLASGVQAEDSLVGKRVVVINDKATLAVSGQPSGTVSECSVFTVDKVEGDWLWIKSQRAYLRKSDVVPFDDAIAHYTRRLETAKTAINYRNRAKIWRLKGELDIALGDMNEAIRLNPNESVWFNQRGNFWDDKSEYDKAIADYSEAIRLNPKNFNAYS